MEPKLFVPEPAQGSTTDVPTDPAKVKEWLAGLPWLNIADVSHAIHKALMVTNRIEIDEKTRVKLMELYREPVDHISQKMGHKYTGLALPLSEKNKMIAEQVRHFQVEMAYGYKRVILDSYDRYKPKLTGKHAAALLIPLHRTIRYLAETLVHSYMFYAPFPTGIWHELHQLYQLAEHHGLADSKVKDSLNHALPHSSISHVYKQALLLDLSDPYHLPARMIAKIRAYLDRWASLATISPANSTAADNCQFLINAENDKAGHHFSGLPKVENPDQLRLLTTVELARNIHTQLSMLRKGHKPDSDGLSDSFFDKLAHDMLLRTINSWGVNPKRIFPRSGVVSSSQIHLAFGLDAINYFVNGGRPFQNSSELMGPFQQRTRIGTFYAQPENTEEHADAEEIDNDAGPGEFQRVTWNIIDESAGGLALEKQGLKDVHIRVGDLVGTQAPGSQSGWAISVVRWMRSTGAEHMEIGIQRLAPYATPVSIRTLNDNNDESDQMYALLLPEIKALKQPPTLVSPRAVFNIDHTLYIDDGEVLRRAFGTTLIEVTGAMERFQFKLLDD